MKEKNMRKYPLQNLLLIFTFAIGMMIPILLSYLVDEIAIGGNYNKLLPWFIVTLGITALGSFLDFFVANYMPTMLGIQNSFILERKAIRNILKMNQPIYSKKEKGYYYNLCQNSTGAYGDLHEELFLNMISNIIYALGIIIVVTYTNVFFGIFFLCYGIILIFISLNSAKPLFQMQKNVVEVQDVSTSDMRNIIENKPGINAIHADNFFGNLFDKSIGKYEKYILKYRFWESLCANLPGIVSKISTVLFLFLAVILIRQGKITTGFLIMGYQYIGYIAVPINTICSIIMRYKANKVHIERVDALEEDAAWANENNEFNKEEKYLIKADNFSFYKGNHEDDFLYNINHLELKERGLYVIKGNNGSGKSMFLNLMLGNISKKASKGRFSVIKNINDAVCLTYPIFAVNGDFKENLFGAEINNELKNILKIDFEDRIINANPVNLSYGQQQKLALLRIFGSDAPILFLDEPLSNLDIEAQRNVVAYIASLKGKKTILVIMHSNELDEFADGIISINEKQMTYV